MNLESTAPSPSQFLYQQRAWLWPILAFALFTPFASTLDLNLTSLYFIPGQGADGLGFASSPSIAFIYKYGTIPALITFILASISLILSWFLPSWKKWRKPALVLVLTYAIGAGLITQVIFKEHWGRPRPKQVTEFGGMQPFRPYYMPNFFHQPQPSKSFPSGHVTTGFYFFALSLVGRRLNNPWLFWTGLSFAIVLGVWLSYARIVQGGHFLTDTLGAALIMWLSAYCFDKWVYRGVR